MSATTDAMECEVSAIRALRSAAGGRPDPRTRAQIDARFGRLLQLMAPRIRHFIGQYGLLAYREDAEQVCAIGVHRAIEMYDPDKAKFTTFVNWQLRGELQGLRFRLKSDQRSPARKLGAVTVSLDSLLAGDEDDAPAGALEDEAALPATEALASETMARRAAFRMLDDYIARLRKHGLRQLGANADRAAKAILDRRLQRDQGVVANHFFDDECAQPAALPAEAAMLSDEQLRQIVRRGVRGMGDSAQQAA